MYPRNCLLAGGQESEVSCFCPVGVVRNSHCSSVKDPTPPVYYTLWRQDDKLNGLHSYVRSAVEPGGTIAQVWRVMHAIDPDPAAGRTHK